MRCLFQYSRNSTFWNCAGAEAASWTCGDSVSITELETTARALAQATAIACSYSFASCKVDDGFACAFADTEIKQAAWAVATAYADMWAGAYSCPGKESCEVTADAVAEAIGSILVTAATEASVNVCLGRFPRLTESESPE